MELIQWYHVWAFVKINDFGKFVGLINGLSWIGYCISLIIMGFYCMEESQPFPKKKYIAGLVGLILLSTFYTILPTQKEVAAIYLIPKVVNSETAQQFAKDASGLPSDFVKLVKTKMDEWITDSLAEQGKAVVKDAVKDGKEAVKDAAKEVVKEAVTEVKK